MEHCEQGQFDGLSPVLEVAREESPLEERPGT